MKPKTDIDEEKLKALLGKDNPFRVPEGYFQSFPEQLMSALPEREVSAVKLPQSSRWAKARPWVAAAAVLCGIVVLFASVRPHEDSTEQNVLAESSWVEEYTEDEMADYMATSLFDEYTLYSYLTDSDY